jgi:hypothetical protein
MRAQNGCCGCLNTEETRAAMRPLVGPGRLGLRIWSIGLTVILLLSQATPAAPGGYGTVCVASRAVTPFRGQVIPPTGEVSSGGLRLKVDKRPSVPWPQRESIKIEGLDLNERHLLAVLDAHGKPIESFWFKFSEYGSADLCMSYDGYQGVGLDKAKRCPWCKCK